MSDAPAGPSSNPNVTALVEALDVRARQAGSEGAVTMLRGVLDTVSDTLASIELRLERLEGPGDEDASSSLADAVQSSLNAFNARLGRLEEAFVKAVEDSGSGTDSVVEQIRSAVAGVLDAQPRPAPPTAVDLTPLLARLGALEARIGEFANRPAPAPTVALPRDVLERVVSETTGAANRQVEALGSRLQALESRIGELANRPTPAPTVALPETLLSRLDALETRIGELADRPTPAPTVALPETLLSRLDALEARIGELADRPAPLPTVALPENLLDRLDAIAAATAADDGSRARLIASVEERMSVVARVVADRTDDVQREFVSLREDQRGLERQAATTLDAVHAVSASLAATTTRLDEVLGKVAAVVGQVESLRDADPRAAIAEVQRSVETVARGVDQLRDRAPGAGIEDAVRRESELLTQRVAALAVGVEATRALVEQLARDAEASLGRKASVVGRRIAQDLGLTSRRSNARRAPELGPGLRP